MPMSLFLVELESGEVVNFAMVKTISPDHRAAIMEGQIVALSENDYAMARKYFIKSFAQIDQETEAMKAEMVRQQAMAARGMVLPQGVMRRQ